MAGLLTSLFSGLHYYSFWCQYFVLKYFNGFVNKVTWEVVSVGNTFQFINVMMKFDKMRAQTEAPT